MIAEAAYKNYFENLATKHIGIQHTEASKAFFYIDNPFDLNAMDAALRNITKKTCLLLDVPVRLMDDNRSNNYVEDLECQFSILTLESDKTKLIQARDLVLPIVEDFLVKIRQDQSAGLLLGLQQSRMNIRNVRIEPIGPINISWYGYTAVIALSCPFAPAVNSGNWLV